MCTRMAAVIAVGIMLSGLPLDAQDLSRYRDFELGSSLASAAKITGVRIADVKVVHRRPAMIQELEWRPLYVLPSTRVPADPVREVVLSFYNDQLFRIVITYDRERTEGLTNEDVIEALSATYGAPIIPIAKRAGSASKSHNLSESVTVAQWEDSDHMLTLSRGTYPAVFRIVAVSKTPYDLAQAAAMEAVRLDAHEAPQREADRRNKEVADAIAAQDKARLLNKAAFRP